MVSRRRDRCIGRTLGRIGRNKKGTLDRLVTEFWPSIPGHRRSVARFRMLGRGYHRLETVSSSSLELSSPVIFTFRIFLAPLQRYIRQTRKKRLKNQSIYPPIYIIIPYHVLFLVFVYLFLDYFSSRCLFSHKTRTSLESECDEWESYSEYDSVRCIASYATFADIKILDSCLG